MFLGSHFQIKAGYPFKKGSRKGLFVITLIRLFSSQDLDLTLPIL